MEIIAPFQASPAPWSSVDIMKRTQSVLFSSWPSLLTDPTHPHFCQQHRRIKNFGSKDPSLCIWLISCLGLLRKLALQYYRYLINKVSWKNTKEILMHIHSTKDLDYQLISFCLFIEDNYQLKWFFSSHVCYCILVKSCLLLRLVVGRRMVLS